MSFLISVAVMVCKLAVTINSDSPAVVHIPLYELEIGGYG